MRLTPDAACDICPLEHRRTPAPFFPDSGITLTHEDLP